MPESHLNFRYPAKKKVVRRAPVSPEAGTRGKTVSQRAQTSPARYRQIARSKPQAPYRITGHPEKFVEGERHGQMVDQRGTGNKQAHQAGVRVRQLLANYLSHTPVGHGLEAGHAALIYDKLAPLFGPGAKMPNYLIGGTEGLKTRGGNPAAGFASGHTIHLDERNAQDLLPLLGGREGKNLVAHETAHTQQSPKMPSVLAEGGADAFANAVASMIGGDRVRASGEYGRYDRTFDKATGKYKLLAALQAQFPKARKAYGR